MRHCPPLLLLKNEPTLAEYPPAIRACQVRKVSNSSSDEEDEFFCGMLSHKENTLPIVKKKMTNPQRTEVLCESMSYHVLTSVSQGKGRRETISQSPPYDPGG